MNKLFILVITIFITVSCSTNDSKVKTISDVESFLEKVEQEDKTLGPVISSAYWISSNFITYDSQKIVADFGKRYSLMSVERANEAATFDDLDLPEDMRRKLDLIKGGFVMPAPLDDALAGELANIESELGAMYGSGKHCFSENDCYDLEAFEQIIDSSRNPDELLKAWTGWREIGKPMKDKYLRMVEIGELGAKDLGYDGLTDLWFSKYDMPAKDFLADTDRVWEEVKPLYDALQCHVRDKLNGEYGNDVVPAEGMLPAHILGNMWGQSWSNIYDIVFEENPNTESIDLTSIIQERDLTEIEMVEIAEDFFLSLGFEPLPNTFWERSLFVKPQDRNVVCHASAWDLDPATKDIRIKMCIEKNAEDFVTIHHELGHIFYYQAYNDLPSVYRSGANDGFHEAVGDLLALSITPDYLTQIGFVTEEKAEAAEQDPIALLMKQALDGVVSLPWTLMLDKWRSGVFTGEITKDNLNSSWWELREKYQGIASPMERGEEYFDPGAKYHIPGNTPYTRYYLAKIMQYQFHEALCNEMGFKGPLHECSIYNNPEAGVKIRDMLAMGQSKPWQDAFEALTGERALSGTSILNYYKPLQEWLEIQNKGRSCGWE